MKADELGSLRPHLPTGYTDGEDSINDDFGPALACEVNKFMKEIMKYTRSNVKNKARLPPFDSDETKWGTNTDICE